MCSTRFIPTHPTLSEGLQECIQILQGTSILKAYVVPEHIQIRIRQPDSPIYNVDDAAPF